MKKLSALTLAACICLLPAILWADNNVDNQNLAPVPSAVEMSINKLDAPARENDRIPEFEENISNDRPAIAPENSKPQEVQERQELHTNTVAASAVAVYTKSAAIGAKHAGKKKLQKLAAAVPSPGEGRQITVTAYAYCLNGRTASGTYTGVGTVAVDPNVIPMGSRIYIPGYGWGKALDTGGSIYGHKIDLWLPSNGDCSNWGVRTVTITVY